MFLIKIVILIEIFKFYYFNIKYFSFQLIWNVLYNEKCMYMYNIFYEFIE